MNKEPPTDEMIDAMINNIRNNRPAPITENAIAIIKTLSNGIEAVSEMMEAYAGVYGQNFDCPSRNVVWKDLEVGPEGRGCLKKMLVDFRKAADLVEQLGKARTSEQERN